MAKTAPASVTRRFLPQEQATFGLLRQIGRWRLWRSQTMAHEIYGQPCGPRVQYHITFGGEADLMLMPRLEDAMLNFELAAAKVIHG
ncbi:hypothetical protein [Variovorax sp. GB1P17]|uniref:hypothetical protein n=1 Tax=Variovorax sp. GB1P17 TaxID=3443740 RepID=UPI003F44B08C